MEWKSIFDVKTYFFEQKSKYTYDRQTIKYMGNVLPNKNVTFEEMNWKTYLTFDIIIEELILKMITDEEVIFDEICQHTMFCMMSAYYLFNIEIKCQDTMLNVNIPCFV